MNNVSKWVKNFLQVKFRYQVADDKSSTEIVFLCPAREKPTGGIKILYNHASSLNRFLPATIQSKIFHPKKPNFSCTWFTHQVVFKRDFNFGPQDLIVIPEVMVNTHFPIIHQMNLKYAIYVQNGYFITKGKPEVLKKAYSNAALILSISDDATQCIRLVYSEVDDRKLMRMHYSIDHEKFKTDSVKKNLITYMPRKLAKHSALVIAFLSDSLPGDWMILPIQQKTETETAAMLAQSKIFLSFSEFEGCPLPPLEAALSGNYVIGYSGEGGNEYFSPPIFNKIHCGDIQSFVAAIKTTIQKLHNHEDDSDAAYKMQLDQLKNTYSQTSEAHDLSVLAKKMVALIQNKR